MKKGLLRKIGFGALGLALIGSIFVNSNSKNIYQFNAGTDEVFYTLNCPKNSTNNSYATYYDVTVSKITWTAPGNQYANEGWRIGGKSLSKVDRYFYSKTALTENVTKIGIKYGAASSVTVNSSKLDVYSTAALAEAGGTGDISSISSIFKASNTVEITKPAAADWTGRFYRFTYNVTIGKDNKFILLNDVYFYKEGTDKEVSSVDSVDTTKSQTCVVKNGSISGSAVTLNVTFDDETTGTKTADHVNVVTSSVGTVEATAWYTESETDNKMKATFNVNVVNNSIEYANYVAAKHSSEPSDDNIINISGVVIGASGGTFFIQEGSYGIMCYQSENSFVKGDTVTLTSGKAFMFNGSPELKGSFTKGTSSEITATTVTTKAGFDGTNLSTLITVNGAVATGTMKTWYTDTSINTKVKLGDDSISLFIDKNAYSEEVDDILCNIAVDESFNIINAVHSISNSTHQIRFTKATTVERLSTRELTSISASIKAGNYYAGNKLSASDFEVTGHYSEEPTSETITEGFTWTVNETENGDLVLGTNKVVVSYDSLNSEEITVTALAQPTYTKLIEFDCESASANENAVTDYGSNSSLDEAGLKKFLNFAAGEEITSTSIFNGDLTKEGSLAWKKGSGGSGIPDSVLKLGTSSASGSFTFTLTSSFDNVSKVVISGYGWTSATTISVNNLAAQTVAGEKTLTSHTFVLSQESKTITISSSLAFCFDTITLYSVSEPEPDDFFISGIMDNNSLYIDNSGKLKVKAPTGSPYCAYAYSEGYEFYSEGCEIVSDGTIIEYLTDDEVASVEVTFYFYADETLSTESFVEVKKTINLINPEGLSDARNFIKNNFDEICTGDGTILDSSDWTTIASEYSALNDKAKAFLVNAMYVINGSGASTLVTANYDCHNDIAQGISKYDYMVAKYSWATNFINRTVDQSSAKINSISNITTNSAGTIAIIIVATTSLTAIGCYFFYKRRKETN